MIASPVETGKFLTYLIFWQYSSLISWFWFIEQSCVKCLGYVVLTEWMIFKGIWKEAVSAYFEILLWI